MTSNLHATELAHDRLADQFDGLMNEYDVARRMEVLIDDFLGAVDLSGCLALDAGCGTGRGTVRLRARGARVVAFDIGPRLVRATSARTGCQPAVGTLLDLPFPDGVFDVVFSSEVIEHTPDPARAALEMFRVLKPGGHLVLSTPTWLWQWPVRVASALRLRPYDGFENFLPASTLRGTLQSAGALVVEHRGLHLVPFQLTWLQPLSRRLDRLGKALLPLMINQCIHCVKHPR
jgi:SAM-dependent methyltransferase